MRPFSGAIVLLALSVLLGPAAAYAATPTWDSNGLTLPLGQDGLGTWDSTNFNWSNGATNVQWINASDTAVFGNGGTAGTVTLGSAITAAGITFDPVAGNYTVTGGTLTLSGTPVITTNADGTISSTLAGTAFTKSGPGTLTLTTGVAYTGTTVVSAGQLRLGGNYNILGSGRDVSIQSGASLYADAWSQNLRNVTLSGGNLDGPGGGCCGSWLINGDVTVTAGTGTSTISSPAMRLVNPAGVTFDVGSGATLDVGGRVNWGVGIGLIKEGAGLMELSGSAWAHTGPTRVNAGTLKLSGNYNMLWASSDVSVENGATLTSQNYAQHIKAVTLNGGTLAGTGNAYGSWLLDQDVTVSGGVNTSTMSATNMAFNNAGGVVFHVGSGAASGIDLDVTGTFFNSTAGGMLNQGFVKAGPGVMRLAGVSTYTAPTTVAEGTLILGGVSSTYNVISFSSGIVVGNAATLQADNWAQNIQALTLQGGTLAGSGGGGFGSFLLNQDVTVSGGVNTSTISAVNVGLKKSGGLTFDVGSGAASGIDLDVTGTIWGGGGTNQPLIKAGSGVMRLLGSNSYTAATVIGDGVLAVNSLANGGVNSSIGASSAAATNLVLNGGTLQYTGSGAGTDRLFSVGTSGGTLDGSGTGAVNFNNTGTMGFNGQTGTRTLTLTGTNTGDNTLAATVGNNGGATSLVKSGTGTWVLTNDYIGYTGTTNVAQGTLKLATNYNVLSTSSAITVQNGATLVAVDKAQHIKAVTLNGGTLSGTGDGYGSWLFDQDVTVSGGANTSTMSATNMAFNKADGVVFHVGSGATSGVDLDVTGTFFNSTAGGMLNQGFVKAGPGVMRLNAANSYSGGTIVNGGTLIAGAGNALGTGSQIINSGTVSLQSSGYNALAYTTGTVTIGAGGVLSADQAGSNAHNLGPLTLNGGTLTSINGPAGPANDGGYGNFLLRGVTAGGSSTSTISSTTLAIVSGSFDVNDVVAGADLIISSKIFSGSLTKNLAGTLSLSGANTYTGATDVNAGTLLVNGSHNGGALYTVASGATLGGTGSTDAPVELRGTMSPGASVESLGTGSETWLDGGGFTLEIDSATGTAGSSPGWDLLDVTMDGVGILDLTGLGPDGFDVDLVSLGPLPDFSADPYSSYVWDFVHASDIPFFDDEDFDLDVSAFTSQNPITNAFGEGQFRILQDGDNLVIAFAAAVPEPGTLVLAALGGLALMLWPRRRRR